MQRHSFCQLLKCWVLWILVLGGCCGSCIAQYRVIPGQTDQDGCSPKTPARICPEASGNTGCYSPPSEKDYIFGLEPKATQLGDLGGRPLVLFSATFSGCGSGTLTHYSLLTERTGALVNLLPKVELTNQSEYRLWTLPYLSQFPLLATADFIQGSGVNGTHFAHHRYRIEIYVYDPGHREYVEKLGYETEKNYPGLDDADQVRVLELERPRILTKLRKDRPPIVPKANPLQ